MNDKNFAKKAYALLKPYWTSSEKWTGVSLLTAIIALNLFFVYLNVLSSFWRNTFYNAIQNYDLGLFNHQLFVFLGLAILIILTFMFRHYTSQFLIIKWRQWLTEHFIHRWLQNRNYYGLQLKSDGTDNPDQRISSDIDSFISSTLSLSVGVLSSIVTLFSFLGILWQLSGSLSFPLGEYVISIPGYLCWAALLYAIVGTWISTRVGHPLIKLDFQQEKKEADFRYSLMRLRENIEGVAFYQGEQEEAETFRQRFRLAIDNAYHIILRMLGFWSWNNAYNQIAVIFPMILVAPRYFAKRITLGDMMQTLDAFGNVQSSLSYIVDSYPAIASWKASALRLITFIEKIEALEKETSSLSLEKGGEGISFKDVTLFLPTGPALFPAFNLHLSRGEHILITGSSGVGKSTLLRALAGIWPFGEGIIQKEEGNYLFLPQKTYMPLGTLKRVVCYPLDEKSVSLEMLQNLMRDCGLDHLIPQLEENNDWSRSLSLGEQQKIGFLRALLQKPDWIFLDESTSAVDEAGELHLYHLLKKRLPNTTLISVGHRSTLLAFHDVRVVLSKETSPQVEKL